MDMPQPETGNRVVLGIVIGFLFVLAVLLVVGITTV